MEWISSNHHIILTKWHWRVLISFYGYYRLLGWVYLVLESPAGFHGWLHHWTPDMRSRKWRNGKNKWRNMSLVGGFNPLKNVSSSVGMMRFPTEWKFIKAMFQNHQPGHVQFSAWLSIPRSSPVSFVIGRGPVPFTASGCSGVLYLVGLKRRAALPHRNHRNHGG